MENNKCQNIKEEIQNHLDENIPINKNIKSHLSECSECAKFYTAARKVRPFLKKSFNNKSLYNKKPDFPYIFEKAEKYKRNNFIRKLTFQIAAALIFIMIGFSSYLGFDRIYLKIRVKNQISYFVKEVFQSNYFEGDAVVSDKEYYNLNDWRDDFGSDLAE
jgi:hypothetical protein